MATAQLRQQRGEISASQVALARYGAQIDAVRAARMRLLTTGAAIGAAIGFAGIADAVSDAAKLQQILLSIKNETGSSNRQLEGFYRTAFTIANQNAMTPVQGGEILRTISRLTAGQFSVEKMMAIAPTVAGYASSVHFNRPDISVEEAAATGIQTAHLFRAYQPAPLFKLLDSAYRLSGMMAEAPAAALRQMTYYVPMFKALHISDDTSIATMALLDRAGFRNKVGTGVRAEVLEALGPLQMTKHAQEGKAGILQQMGLLDARGKFAWNNKDGSVNYFGELGAISKWSAEQAKKHVPYATTVAQVYSALGKQGGTIGALMLDPQMRGILAGLQRYQHDPNVGLDAANRNRQAGLGFQFSRAVSNLTAVMTELGYPWLQGLAGFFRGVGDQLHNFQAWLHEHRGAEKIIGAAFAGITAILTGVAVFGAGALAVNALGIGSMLTGITSWITGLFVGGGMLDTLFSVAWAIGSKFIPVVGWISAIVTALWALNHLPDIAGQIAIWWAQNQEGIGYTIGYAFEMIRRELVAVISYLWRGAVAAISAIGSALSQNWAQLFLPGGAAVMSDDIGLAIAKALQGVKMGPGDLFSGLDRGVYGADHGHSYQYGGRTGGEKFPQYRTEVHFHGPVTVKANDPEQFLESLRPFMPTPTQIRSIGGAYRTSPSLPNPLTVGSH